MFAVPCFGLRFAVVMVVFLFEHGECCPVCGEREDGLALDRVLNLCFCQFSL